MTPFLNFVSDDEDQFVPKELKRFSFDLKMAKKIGEAGKNTDICQGNVIINNVYVTLIFLISLRGDYYKNLFIF